MSTRVDERVDGLIDKLLVEFETKVLPRLESIIDDTKRYLYFIAWLNTWLCERNLGRIIVTGGFAVEIYTGRAYRTMDVDIIVEKNSYIVERFLEKISERIARGYLPKSRTLSIKSIDIVASTYTKGLEPVKLVIDNYYVYLEPPEELLLTYLNGWKYWNSTEDRDKSLWILIVWLDKLNLDYVKNKAIENDTYDKLRELLELIKKGGMNI